jgi:putative IMPACT (imprinted ancient) family translation regulator
MVTSHVCFASRLNKKIEQKFSGLIQQFKEHGYAGCLMIEAINDLVPAER